MYNHKETVKSLTNKEYKENIEWIRKTYLQAYKGKLVTCRGCNKSMKLYLLYRCWFCGSYFCRICAEKHFGKK